MKREKHLFSIFVKDFWVSLNELIIKDADTIHRIISVLRLQEDDHLIIFNNNQGYHCSLKIIKDKKILYFIILEKIMKKIHKDITLWLPLLEKEYMEKALYSAGQYGVKQIYIIEYEKSHKTWGRENDWIRAQKFLIAGAEQSKSFFVPQLFNKIIKFNQIGGEKIEIENMDQKILLDEHADQRLITFDFDFNQKSFLITWGPEAGFFEEEKQRLINIHKFKSASLGSVILRSCDALLLTLGILNT